MYVEIEDDPAAFTKADRAALARVLLSAGRGDPHSSMSLRAFVRAYRGHGVGEYTLRRWYQSLKAGRLIRPTPPPLRDWTVWHLREDGWTCFAIAAAVDSPASTPVAKGVVAALSGKKANTRETQAKRAVKAVRAFKQACDQAGSSWVFTFCANQTRKMVDD